MTKSHIQFAGLVSLTLLASALLAIIAYAMQIMGAHITSDGKVPVLDAGIFTASLLAFQQTVGAIRSIWESQERSTLAEGLRDSTPNATPPADAKQAAQQVADASTAEADRISNEGPTA